MISNPKLDSYPMSKRTTIVLPDKVFDSLENWADDEGRATANLAAYLVEQAVRVRFPEDFPPKIKNESATPTATAK
jgi:hypothetical protein